MSNQNQGGVWEVVKPFVFGGISGCIATSCIQPIDTLKVQLQIKGEQKGMAALSHDGKVINTGVRATMHEIYADAGIKGFYKGLGSAILRQILYATTRLGLYRSIADNYKAKNGRDLDLPGKMLASAFSGFVGSLVGNPADLCLVRFQSDSTLPVNERRNYKNVFDALGRIVREEGLVTLWRGSAPTILRAISMNLGMLTTYDEIKQRILKFEGRTKEHTSDRFLASAGAGLVCSFMSLPFDNIKTKLQKMKKGPDGKFPYTGVPDCLMKTIAREGVTGLWTSFPVYYSRVAPHAMITLIAQDALHMLSNKNKH